MNIRFSIHFHAKWGEELYIIGSSAELGNHEIEKAFKLSSSNGTLWEGIIALNPLKERVLSYKYFVKRADGTIYHEAGKGRFLALNTATSEVIACDQWQGNGPEAPFLTAPFTDIFFAEENTPYIQLHKHNYELILQVTLPNVPASREVLLCGNTAKTGEWDVSKAAQMQRINGVKWVADFNIDHKEDKEFIYKFVIRDKATGTYCWEEGENRKITLPKILKNSTTIIEHSAANFPLTQPKFTGVSIPLFSLRSKSSYGIGDFNDLKLLTDWAKTTGLSVIQLLPINDTTQTGTRRDSYPYNCISTFALHPIYIRTEEVGTLSNPEQVRKFGYEGKLLNHKAVVDYEEVFELKMAHLKALYEEIKSDTQAEPGYYTFIKQNKEWLYPYAAFCTLRDKFKTADFREWGEYAVFSEEMLDKLTFKRSKLYNEVEFHIFIQYHLHKQMQSAKEYARQNGVAIKGDIPIGISRNSADAWQYPLLFNFGQQAGAPPDIFSAQGQNWGFPTYNWEEMAKDHYAWWTKRLSRFATYFDAYRIDHILGFFRIWEIPLGSSDAALGHFSPALPLSKEEISGFGIEKITKGLFLEDATLKGKYHPAICGKKSKEYALLSPDQQQKYDTLSDYFFYQRHNDLWYNGAMKKLQHLIASGNMLTCGEDLGMLNPSVFHCMENLKILSLELQQMPKKPGIRLANPQEYPYLSVCTTSTHDCEPLRVWLGRELNQYATMVGEGDEHYYDATPESCLEVLRKNLAAPSMLAIFPIQDWLSIDGTIRNKYASTEQINNPSDPHHYWKYRMHLDLEDLLEAEQLNQLIRTRCAR